LHSLLAAGSLDAATRLLLVPGANIEARDSLGRTPLHNILQGGKEDAALTQLVLSFGADIEARTPCGQTPLLLAALNGHLRSCELLLRVGADVDACDDDGRTALIEAAAAAAVPLARLLLGHGAAPGPAVECAGSEYMRELLCAAVAAKASKSAPTPTPTPVLTAPALAPASAPGPRAGPQKRSESLACRPGVRPTRPHSAAHVSVRPRTPPRSASPALARSASPGPGAPRCASPPPLRPSQSQSFPFQPKINPASRAMTASSSASFLQRMDAFNRRKHTAQSPAPAPTPAADHARVRPQSAPFKGSNDALASKEHAALTAREESLRRILSPHRAPPFPPPQRDLLPAEVNARPLTDAALEVSVRLQQPYRRRQMHTGKVVLAVDKCKPFVSEQSQNLAKKHTEKPLLQRIYKEVHATLYEYDSFCSPYQSLFLF
jgi:hypothetical protein